MGGATGKLVAYLQLTLAMALVGSAVVVGKLMIESFPVYLAGGLSSAIGAVILVPALYLCEGGPPALNRRDLLVLFLQALTGIFLFRVLLLYGLAYTTATESGIITSTTPAVIGLISLVFLREKLPLASVGGIGLAVAGVLVINIPGGPSSGEVTGFTLGNLLVFGAVVSEALFTVFGKAASDRLTPLATATSASVLSLVLFLPLGLAEAASFDFSSVGLAGWVPILHYGVFVTALGYLLWFGGLSRVPASTAGVFAGVLPVSAVLLSYVVLGEPFAWVHLVGMAFVLSAILLMARSSPSSADEEANHRAPT